MSKGLGGNMVAVETKPLHGIKRIPNVTTSGQQYNIGEKPSVILYTSYINLHAGTPKTTTLFICLGVPDYIQL